MLSLKISDSRDFMKKLLTEDTFDTFLLLEASVKSGSSYHISGRINRDFFDDDELELMPSTEYSTWKNERVHVFNIIKGTKLPLGFKIIFLLSKKGVDHIIEKNNLPLSYDQVSGLFVNILFDNKTITLTTSASMKTFSLDKSLEQLWDKNVLAYLKQQGILFEEL